MRCGETGVTWMAAVRRVGVAATRAVLRAEAAPEAADGRTAMSPLRIKHGVSVMEVAGREVAKYLKIQ